MFGMQILDLVIGMLFIFLLFALITSAAMEIISGIFDSRAKNLRVGICNLFCLPEDSPHRKSKKVGCKVGDEPELVVEFFAHPLVKALGEDGTPPSYIPAATFSTVVLDLFDPSRGECRKDTKSFRDEVDKKFPGESDLKKTLYIMISQADGDVEKLKSGLETWYNNGMERISAWYKRKTQVLVLVVAIVICGVMNVDSVHLARDLYGNPATRAVVIQNIETNWKTIETAAKNGSDKPRSVEEIKKEMDSLSANLSALNGANLKLGWQGVEVKGWGDLFLRIFGILATAIGVSLGAPFWFDTLNRFMAIRAVGKSPEEKAEKLKKAEPVG